MSSATQQMLISYLACPRSYWCMDSVILSTS